MDRTFARNLLIVLVLAALLAFAPGAGITAEVANTLVNGAILTVLVFAVGIFYRRHQQDLWGLGDEHRGLLYAALGGFVVLMAGRETLTDSSGGTAILIIGLVSVAAAIYLVVRRFRAYN